MKYYIVNGSLKIEDNISTAYYMLCLAPKEHDYIKEPKNTSPWSIDIPKFSSVFKKNYKDCLTGFESYEMAVQAAKKLAEKEPGSAYPIFEVEYHETPYELHYYSSSSEKLDLKAYEIPIKKMKVLSASLEHCSPEGEIKAPFKKIDLIIDPAEGPSALGSLKFVALAGGFVVLGVGVLMGSSFLIALGMLAGVVSGLSLVMNKQQNTEKQSDKQKYENNKKAVAEFKEKVKAKEANIPSAKKILDLMSQLEAANPPEPEFDATGHLLNADKSNKFSVVGFEHCWLGTAVAFENNEDKYNNLAAHVEKEVTERLKNAKP